MNQVKSKLEVLAKFLKCDVQNIEYNESRDIFKHQKDEYLVLTDDEADEKCREYILDTVWAFRPEFLESHLKSGVSVDVVTLIQSNNKCESNNAALLSLIKDLDRLIENAIDLDGRGNFLSTYDGTENYVDGFNIYRIN